MTHIVASFKTSKYVYVVTDFDIYITPYALEVSDYERIEDIPDFQQTFLQAISLDEETLRIQGKEHMFNVLSLAHRCAEAGQQLVVTYRTKSVLAEEFAFLSWGIQPDVFCDLIGAIESRMAETQPLEMAG